MIDRLARQISFFAPAAVMSAWATVMLHAFASGHLNRLLSPMFHSYVLIAAILLLVLSALYLLLYQPTEETTPALAPTGNLRQFGRWLVLLIPVVAASILSPSALSSTTMNNRSSTAGVAAMPSWNQVSQQKAKEVLDADPNQPAPVDVTDLITISRSPEQMAGLRGTQGPHGRPLRRAARRSAQAGPLDHVVLRRRRATRHRRTQRQHLRQLERHPMGRSRRHRPLPLHARPRRSPPSRSTASSRPRNPTSPYLSP